MRSLARTFAAFAVGAAACTLATAGPAAAADTAEVSILHGVPGLNVDVYANGDKILDNFKPGTLTDPLKLPAGSYDLAVFKAGDPKSGTPAIKADDVEVPGGANLTVVANLDADGKPVLTPFVNDVSKIAAGQARITVRHTAAAPAVDVRAGGKPVFKGLTNPKQAKADLPAGRITADVALAGTDTVAIGPAKLNLKEGTNTIVYAWGSAEDKNLDLAVQTITGLHSAPGGVPSGTGGLLDDSLPRPLLVLTIGGLTCIGVAGAGAGSSLRRRRIASRA
jgi:hypothetical protein